MDADETPLDVEPVDDDGVRAVAIGIVCWAVALVVLALIGKRGEVALGVRRRESGSASLALPYVLRRRAAYRAGGCPDVDRLIGAWPAVRVVSRLRVARGIERRGLLSGQVQPGGPEVVLELLRRSARRGSPTSPPDGREPASATCAIDTPRSAATARRRPRRPRSGPAPSGGSTTPRHGPGSRRAGSRPSGVRPSLYLPVSQPPPKGDQGSRPRPFSRQAGTISHSISRDEQVVLRLQRHQRRPASTVDEVARLLDLPAGEVRQPGDSRPCRRGRRRRGTPASPRAASPGPRRGADRGRCGRHRAVPASRRARGEGAGATYPRSLASRHPSGSVPWSRAPPGRGLPGMLGSQRPMIDSERPGYRRPRCR